MRATMKSVLTAAVAVTIIVTSMGCGSPILTPRERLTLAGGALGAGTGALIGSAVPSVGTATGAAIGGGMGLVSGAVVGNEVDMVQAKEQQTQALMEQQQKDMEEQRRELQLMKQREAQNEELQNERTQASLQELSRTKQSLEDMRYNERIESTASAESVTIHHTRRHRRHR